MYVVTGATGHTGGVVAEKLLAAGKKVRVIGREAKRLERFTKKGAEAGVVDVTNAADLTKTFSGVQAAYVMIPPNPSAPDVLAYQSQVTESLASAIKTNGTKYVVVLSSFGADKTDKTGPVVGLRHLEKKLEAISGLNAIYLRAGYFMENLLPQVGAIKSLGSVVGPVKSDLPLPMIATRDIGAAAAEALLKLGFEGKQAHELQGPRDVNYAEAAKIIGAVIGKPDLKYMHVPGGQLKSAFEQMGMSPSMAELILEMVEGLNMGHMKMSEPRSPANSTPTTLETFAAEVFGPAYREQAATA
jgi:uncharacterized protein YbjT (DUF2867 family)